MYAPLPWPVGELMRTVAAAAASAAERRDGDGAGVAVASEGAALGVTVEEATWVEAGGAWTTVMQAANTIDAADANQ